MGLRCGALNDGLLSVRKLKAFFGHGVIGPAHDFAQAGGIVHHGCGVQGSAAAHAHGVVRQGVHHGQDGVGVLKIGGKFRSARNHDFVTINAIALDVRRLLHDGVISGQGLGIIRLDHQLRLQGVAGDLSGKGVIIVQSPGGVEGQVILQLIAAHLIGQGLIAVHGSHILQHRAELHLGIDLGVGGVHGRGGKVLDGGQAHISPHQRHHLCNHTVHGGGPPIDAVV